MTTEKIGNVWYTEGAEYGVRQTHSGYAVTRGDGSYAEFTDRDEAEDAAERLARGEAADKEYEWHDA